MCFRRPSRWFYGGGQAFLWQHNCKDGQYSSAKVHRSVKVTLKDSDQIPSSVVTHAITVEQLPGLEPEVIDGL